MFELIQNWTNLCGVKESETSPEKLESEFLEKETRKRIRVEVNGIL